MLNLIIANKAVQSIVEIRDYIAKDNNLDVAENVALRIRNSFVLLAKNPHIGKKFKHKKTKVDVLYWISGNYLVFYWFDDKNINIINVVDGRSDYIKNIDFS